MEYISFIYQELKLDQRKIKIYSMKGEIEKRKERREGGIERGLKK